MLSRFGYLLVCFVTYSLLAGCGGSSEEEENSPSPAPLIETPEPKPEVSVQVSHSVDEDGILSGTTASSFNNSLSVSVEREPENGSLVLNSDGTYVYTPDTNYAGPDSFIIVVTNDGVPQRQEIDVVVSPVNDAPSAVEKTFSLYQSEFIRGTLEAEDNEGDELQFVFVTRPENGSVELSEDGTFQYHPNTGFEGVDRFSYRVSDGSLFSNEATVMFDVSYTLLEIEPASLFDSVEVDTTAPGKALVKNNSDNDVEIDFDASMPWIISTDERKIVPAKGELEIRWVYEASNVSPGGPYHMDIEVVSSEPGLPSLTLPVSLTITEDMTPPGAIADLSAQAVSVDQIDLSFAAVADNGVNGKPASRYQVRYFDEAITEENWLDATAFVTELVPSPPGEMETLSVPGLDMNTTYFFAVRAEDDSGLLGPVSNTVQAKTLEPGAPVLSPELIPVMTLEQNQQGQQEFILSNGGDLDLQYELKLKNVEDTQTLNALDQNRGGPDQFGYRWIDSREQGGPRFDWVDISATGNQIGGLFDDIVVGPFDIGFAFDFYEETYSEFYLSSNGFLSFSFTGDGCCQGLPVGNADYVNNIIAWLWADLYPHSDSSKVYYQTIDNKLVLQFDNYGEYAGPGRVDAQVILHSNGDILLQYKAFNNNLEQKFSSIGIENADGSDGLQIALDDPDFLTDELAVLVSTDTFSPSWASIDPVEGGLSPGEEQVVTLSYDAPQEIDTYSANLIVTDRDTPENTWVFPIELEVVEDETPPPAVEDLAVTEALFDRVMLTWTASADAGSPNTPLLAHELRYSNVAITEDNWEDATPVALRTGPLAPGEIEVATAEGLSSDTNYFFALKVIDLSENSSALSNITRTKTLKPPQASPSEDAFSFNLSEGESAEQLFSLANLGDSPLNYQLRMEARPFPENDESAIRLGSQAQTDEAFTPVELNALPVAGSYLQSEVIVRFKGLPNEDAFIALRSEYAATLIKRFPELNMEIWQLPGNDILLSTVQQLNADPRIGYAEPNYRLSKLDAPDDIRFDELWGLHNTGQTGGSDDADIDVLEAWDITQGLDSVVVAVIDSGIDYEHDDLAGNMWINEGEIPDNGVDDDNNGYIDDVHGFNFVSNIGDPFDDNRHGTHVAGTIGAVTDNGIGIAGVSPNVRLMAVKFLNGFGSGSTDDAIESIIYAVDNGAHILNNSWGGGGYSLALQQAIEYANEQGVLFVAAAGNAGTDNDVNPTYPANYEVDNVLAVAATDHNDNLASFSQYGQTTVDLGAPGVEIVSALPNQGYGPLDGTSMASPHVAGAAALLKARDFSLSPLAIKQALMDGVDPIPALDGKTVTGGRLNVFNSLQLIFTWLEIEGLMKGTLEPGESAEFSLAVDSTDLEQGEYVIYMIVETNDPDSPELIVPVTLIVGPEPEEDEALAP